MGRYEGQRPRPFEHRAGGADEGVGWWEVRTATFAGWGLGGFALAYVGGVIVSGEDADAMTLLLLVAIGAGIAGLIVGATNSCRFRWAAGFGLAGGTLLAAGLPPPAGIGLFASPLGFGAVVGAGCAAFAAFAYGAWRGSDDDDDGDRGRNRPDDRAFAPPAERARILRPWRRRRRP